MDFSAVFDDIKRSELRRMIGISFIGVINVNGLELQKETLKTSNADFFEISNIPKGENFYVYVPINVKKAILFGIGIFVSVGLLIKMIHQHFIQ